MVMRSFLKISGDFAKPDGMGRRKWAQIMTAAHADMAEYWHKNFLPKHFQPGNRARYNFRPRSIKYQRRKEWLASQRRVMQERGSVQMGGKVDLVFTGAMMRQIVGNNTIRAFPTRATLTMSGPRYVTMRAYKTSQPDKGAEITQVREDEARVLAEVMDKSISKSIRSNKD